MTNTQVLVLVLLFAAGWALQMGGGGWQARHFMREARRVRLAGRSAIGVGGRRASGKAYVAMAVDAADRVVAATSLHGRTVMAKPKDQPALVGHELVDLLEPADGPLGDTAVGAAAADAARHLLGATEGTEAPREPAAEDDGPRVAAAQPSSSHLPS